MARPVNSDEFEDSLLQLVCNHESEEFIEDAVAIAEVFGEIMDSSKLRKELEGMAIIRRMLVFEGSIDLHRIRINFGDQVADEVDSFYTRWRRIMYSHDFSKMTDEDIHYIFLINLIDIRTTLNGKSKNPLSYDQVVHFRDEVNRFFHQDLARRKLLNKHPLFAPLKKAVNEFITNTKKHTSFAYDA